MSYMEVREVEATESIESKTIRIEKHVQHSFKEDCLNFIGKFITEKEMNLKACRNAILGIWGNPVGLVISEIGRNMLLFSFKDKKKGKQALNGGSWSIKGYLLNLQEWMKGQSVFEVKNDFMDFWVQIHVVPLELLERDTTKVIGDMMGLVSEVEDPWRDTKLMRTFLRVKVALDVTEPLPTGFYLERDDLPNAWIHFKYERIQDHYCLNCGRLGHRAMEGKNQKVMAS
ncbi:uncharacterized protein [Arachis hypogaea]|uniref:uncharacterized protein n=1 Tax=Arachis hypogaea TaxID=3818 RepID=UPI003B212463